MKENNSKTRQIFEYLKAIVGIMKPVKRDVNGYEKLIWQYDLPVGEGCYIGGSGSNEEAWLEVHQPKIQGAPMPPEKLIKWFKSPWDNSAKKPEHRSYIEKQENIEHKDVETQEVGQQDTERNIIKISFKDDKDRVEQWENYITNDWTPWAEEAFPKLAPQNLYTKLFLLYQKLEKESEIYELLWGHGLLSWNCGDEKIYRPLIVTSVELKFDYQQGVFYILPYADTCNIETDMLTKLDIINMKNIEKITESFQVEQVNPWNFEEIESVLSEVVHLLSPKGSVISSNSTSKPNGPLTDPTVYNCPVLFLRRKSPRLWEQEFQNIIDAIDNGYIIPDTVNSIVSDSPLIHDADEQAQWEAVGEDLLFPLPANQEQMEIAGRLSKHVGVAVQGPPGTGKSHTIANLVCHLLAHGKRVLVTSHTEKALKVLADKIPTDIRALCVSLLGGDSNSIKQIENSVQQMSERLSTEDLVSLEESISNNKKQLNKCKENIVRLEDEFKKSIAIEYKEIDFKRQNIKPIEAAKWLRENESSLGWIKDKVKFKEEVNISDSEMVKFYHLASILDYEKMKNVSSYRPELDMLPNNFELSRIIDDIEKHEHKVKQLKTHLDKWQVNNEIDIDLEQTIQLCQNGIEQINKFNTEWLNIILEDVNQGDIRRKFWHDITSQMYEYIDSIYESNNLLASTDVELPKDTSFKKIREDLELVKERLEQGKKINYMYKALVGRKAAFTLESTLINGEKISMLEDIEAAILKVTLEENKKSLSYTWDNYMCDIGAETIDIDEPRIILYIKDILDIIKISFDWEELSYGKLQDDIELLGVPKPYKWTSKEFWLQLKDGLSAIQANSILEQKTAVIEEIKEYLTTGSTKKGANILWMDLLNALENRDVEKYKISMELLNEVHEIEKSYKEFEVIEAKLIKISPLWVLEILTQTSKGEELSIPENWREAIEYAKLRTLMDELYEKTKTQQLIDQLTQNEDLEKSLVEKIVAESTWLNLIKRTTEQQKRSLIAWLQFVRKIGKGTGKYANKHRENAKKQMAIAQGAIPVWIMPIHRVIENMDLNNEPFDVVIIDESSQSNLFAISALIRAKKAVVVGDDNQISPEAVGLNQQQVDQLIKKHLYDIPQKETFDMQTSLFDIAIRIFPGQVMLKEHFRCVPEIIQFSNDLMYGGRIVPLRLPNRHEILEPVIETVKVEDGKRDEDTSKAINIREAEEIVKHVVKCCNDDRYKNKTMGVISLQGEHQARLIESMLIDELGIFEIVYRSLTCGDAYAFQGDERDVIFLSMVAASNMRAGALTRRSDMQRFNVAASRAKDQMFLYHSIDADELNENCMRAKLLRYCTDTASKNSDNDIPFEEEKYLFNSKFEEDVYNQISEYGYLVRAHVKVGKYVIPLVVEGTSSRLAIECIGDNWAGIEGWQQDKEKQNILRRVGWKFWRVRGSIFYREPEKALQRLWERLNELNILPIKK